MQNDFQHIFNRAIKQDRLAQKTIYEMFSEQFPIRSEVECELRRNQFVHQKRLDPDFQ